jgi:hypothetical protein
MKYKEDISSAWCHLQNVPSLIKREAITILLRGLKTRLKCAPPECTEPSPVPVFTSYRKLQGFSFSNYKYSFVAQLGFWREQMLVNIDLHHPGKTEVRDRSPNLISWTYTDLKHVLLVPKICFIQAASRWICIC